jgi:ABC-type amino acid transport substrate-binding protein
VRLHEIPALSEVKQYIKVFIDFVITYPSLSIVVSFLLILVLMFILRKPIENFCTYTRSCQLSTIIRVLGVAVLAAFLLVKLILAANKSKPEFIEVASGQTILSEDYILNWRYAGAVEGTKFRVDLENPTTRSRKTFNTSSLHQTLPSDGPLALTVTAVNPDGMESSSDPLHISVYRDSIERIKATHVLKVGVHEDNSAGVFCYTNVASGKLDGVDIALAKRLAEALARKWNIEPLDVKAIHYPWDGVIFEPNNYNVDMAIASISIKDDRAQQIDFSDPYLETQLAIVQSRDTVKSTTPLFNLFDFFTLRTIGVHQETTSDDLAKHLKGFIPHLAIKTATSNIQLFGWLGEKKVDAVIYDYDRTHAEVGNHPSWVSRKINYEGLALKKERYGITFARINGPFRDVINSILPSINVENLIKEYAARLGDIKPIPVASDRPVIEPDGARAVAQSSVIPEAQLSQ